MTSRKKMLKPVSSNEGTQLGVHRCLRRTICAAHRGQRIRENARTVRAIYFLKDGQTVVGDFLGLAVICDDWFVPSLEKISDVLDLSEDVAGATFMAAGGSAPELMTSFADTFTADNSIGVGTIVGSAMFNILVIVALAALVIQDAELLIDWRPMARDCIFYSLSIFLLIIFFRDEEVTKVLKIRIVPCKRT